jgi:hypothetical protein
MDGDRRTTRFVCPLARASMAHARSHPPPIDRCPRGLLAHLLRGCARRHGLLAHRQSPSPHQLRKRTRSRGLLLRRHCTASPCPTPALAATCRNVEAATVADDGSPAITRTTIRTCRAHYPDVSSGCACRLLPHSCSLPQMAGGSASALSLSRPAQAFAVGTAIAGRPRPDPDLPN